MANPGYDSLVARFYDAFLEGRSDDAAWFVDYFKDKEGPLLELAAGTGRILVPLLRGGVDAEGLDNSAEMLAVAAAKLRAAGLSCALHEMDMTDCRLDRKYAQVLVACGSFMLLDDEGARRCLIGARDLLREGGQLVLDLFIPWDDIRRGRTEGFLVARDVGMGEERCLVHESFEHVVADQVKRGVYKYERYVGGALAETRVSNLDLRWYHEAEILALLRDCGWRDARVRTDWPGYARNESFMVTAAR
ncbi:MAG: class I SAM-dependent methyltransferase [Spirochaetaceae bacterium]|nr:class I SAM-dependent methyltransferase [Spirochaetaceae bacterium]